MDTFFNAKSIAVIGVSARADNMGRRILMNLQRYHFPGVVYPVGPSGGTFLGHYIYKSVEEIGRPVELAVILTPAKFIPAIVHQCGKIGIRRVIVESGGFAETDRQGRKLADELRCAAEENDIRFLGPNGIGTSNPAAGICLGFPAFPINAVGGTSIITQSGGVGLTYLIEMEVESMGVAKFASVGNKMNVDEVDLLEYFMEDPKTSRVVCYLESFARGREFCDLVARYDKPVIVHKSNVGELSSKIAASHTTAMLSDDRVVNEALRQRGAYRARSIRGAINAAKVFSLPPMTGTRVGVVSRSGGHAVIAADTCDRRGFTLPSFHKHVLELAQQHVRAGVIKLQNPLDLGDLFEMDTYKKIMSDVVMQEQIDGIVLLLAYFSASEPKPLEGLLDHIKEIVEKHQKPIVLVLHTWPELLVRMKKRSAFPIFETAEEAVEALYTSHAHHERVMRRSEAIPRFKADKKTATRILAENKGASHLGAAAYDIIEAYGIDAAKTRVAGSAAEAVRAAKALGYPVACKVESPDASHKTDVGGVLLNLQKGADVKNAFDKIRASLLAANPKANFQGVLVQSMERRGLEFIVGAHRDPDFGPLVILGWGGTIAEAVGPPIIRLAPVSRKEAFRMIDKLPAHRIIEGLRNYPAVDAPALADIIIRVSRMIVDLNDLAEMDLNPVRVWRKGRGGMALDARIIPVK